MTTGNALFALKKPCGNCPFKKEGAIHLSPGRVEGIVHDLMSNDYAIFHCHKTVHGSKGGEWDEDGEYTPSGNESACIGAMIYQLKAGAPPVALRFYLMTEPERYADLMAQANTIIDPKEKVDG